MFVPLFFSAVAADIAGTLLKWALLISTAGISYTKSPAVNVGWPIMRDLANMIVVLGFVVIGIATTLRIQEYQAKKTLVPLIIAALLINFSLLITGIFIDATNIATNFFFSKIGNRAFTLQSLAETFKMVGNIPSDSWTAFLPKIMALMSFNFFAFFVFIFYALLILTRIVALWILVILSPLAFVCYVFPATKSIWQAWWKNFSQWCIIGIPAGLFLYIGSQMITGIIDTPIPTFAPTDFLSAETIKTLTGFLSFFLPGLFLIVGFLVSLQFSAMGASAILNAANKYKGVAMAAGLGVLAKTSGTVGKQAGKLGNYLQGSGNVIGKGAGWALKTTAAGANMLGGAAATTQKTRSAFGRLGETIGAIPVGTTAAKEIAAVKTEADRIKLEYNRAKAIGDTKTMERIRNEARTAQGTRGAAAMKVVTDAKDLHNTFKDATTGKIDLAKANSRLDFAARAGAEDIKKEATKVIPDLERQNAPVVDKIQSQHPGWSRLQAEHEAVVRAAAKTPEESLDRDFVDSIDYTVLRDAGARMTDKKKEALKRSSLESIKQERIALAPTLAARSALSPQELVRWRELARKQRTLNIL